MKKKSCNFYAKETILGLNGDGHSEMTKSMEWCEIFKFQKFNQLISIKQLE